jgi:hypothetical protein
MKLASHVVTADTGLAPNPFHGFCTTGLCTPSHRKAKLEPRDWLIGHSRKSEGNQLVYAMQVAEVLEMDDYFRDSRFQSKKPNPAGAKEEQCGDNFYYKENKCWRRLPSRFHNTCGSFFADLKDLMGEALTGSPVFVANHFYYFGASRITIPTKFQGVIQQVQGIKHTMDPLAKDFVDWIKANYRPGILGKPKDFTDHSQDAGPMITDWLSDCTNKPAMASKGCKPRAFVVPTKKGCK